MAKLQLQWNDYYCSHILELNSQFLLKEKTMCNLQDTWGDWEFMSKNSVQIQSLNNKSIIQIRLSATKTSNQKIYNSNTNKIYMNYRDNINLQVDAYKWGIEDVSVRYVDHVQHIGISLPSNVYTQINKFNESNKSSFIIKKTDNEILLSFKPCYDYLDNRSDLHSLFEIVSIPTKNEELEYISAMLNKLQEIAEDLISGNNLKNIQVIYE